MRAVTRLEQRVCSVTDWPHDAESLDAEQRRLAAQSPELWTLPRSGTLRAAGGFVAFARGEQGPGQPGDHEWVGAALVEMPDARVLARVVVRSRAGARYDRGRLALREGPALAEAIAALGSPEVVLVDATGRDHPRGAGLAVHLGAVLEVPTVGVTHRPLLARGEWPPEQRGASTPLVFDSTVVGAWLRTRAHARPLAVHAGWRTDVATAVEIVRRCVVDARTPEPLRQARIAARVARARAEAAPGGTTPISSPPVGRHGSGILERSTPGARLYEDD
jgi:deoxyribonuclease V